MAILQKRNRKYQVLYNNYTTYITSSFFILTSFNVTGEKLWLDRDLNPGPFAYRANTTTELTSHPVI